MEPLMRGASTEQESGWAQEAPTAELGQQGDTKAPNPPLLGKGWG